MPQIEIEQKLLVREGEIEQVLAELGKLFIKADCELQSNHYFKGTNEYLPKFLKADFLATSVRTRYLHYTEELFLVQKSALHGETRMEKEQSIAAFDQDYFDEYLQNYGLKLTSKWARHRQNFALPGNAKACISLDRNSSGAVVIEFEHCQYAYEHCKAIGLADTYTPESEQALFAYYEANWPVLYANFLGVHLRNG